MKRPICLLVLILAAACRTAPVPGANQATALPTELARRAVPLSPTATGTATATTGTTTQSPRASSGPSAKGSAPPQSFRAIASTSDPTADAGSKAPPYADLRGVLIESDGTRARITVTVAGSAPTHLPSGEQIGLGVDLYRRASQAESDYQLYATGDEDGWLAYLDTPKGFVTYPGTFEIGGAKLVFTVSWAALGNLRGEAFRAFLDWDREGLVVNDVAEDHAPDQTKARFAR